MARQKRQTTDAVLYGGLATVNLMPPEVAQRKRDRKVARNLGMLVLVVAVIVAGGVAASAWLAAESATRLDAERSTTIQLQQERLKYSEVTQVKARIATIDENRANLAQTEILWSGELAPVLDVFASSGGAVTQAQVRGQSPGAEGLGVAGPLREPRVATLSLSVQTEGLPDSSAWLRALAELAIVADASVDSVSGAPSEPYTTTMTVNIGVEALSGRFASGIGGGD